MADREKDWCASRVGDQKVRVIRTKHFSFNMAGGRWGQVVLLVCSMTEGTMPEFPW